MYIVVYLYVQLYSLLSPHRSQRDLAGEKEARAKLLAEHLKEVAMLEAHITTAENDKRQFDAEVKRGSDQKIELRSVNAHTLLL